MKRFAVVCLTCMILRLFSASISSAAPPQIIDHPIAWSSERTRLTEEYTKKHYGVCQTEIVPQAVVIHWTASDTWESVYAHFFNENRGDGTLNVASHFVVDRDGTIYRLTPETALNRHIIGYNWCSIGIENVGGIDNVEDLTEKQLDANVRLVKYLYEKYPTIQYVFGHYQQDDARESGLYIENVSGYRSEKIDPGPLFMRNLRERLTNLGLSFFSE